MRKIALLALFTGLLSAADGPQPPAIDPGGPGKAPSDAVILFDGKDLSAWLGKDGGPAKWAVENGQMVCKTGTGNIHTKQKFGSAQLHVEFATPNQADAKGQAKGNSGVYLQGRYEIQVLDSYNNPTYANGSAGAVYGQSAPAVNASRQPEQWQSYDIIFHAPKCYGNQVIAPGTVTILHNGVLIQDHFPMTGPTPGGQATELCQPGPLMLQDHTHPDVANTALRFRNLWIRPLQ
ncbi:MAG: DUF1080 domain-containing protein [Bryobacterales bacterium]|nr:DUF1080 domain-containing protein [Bryobacterales bacterium]